MVSLIFKTANGDFQQYLNKNISKYCENETIIVVPEQHLFSFEQDIKKLNKNVSVVSFQKLCYRIFKKYGGVAGERASRASKISIVNLILYKLRDKLKIYGGLVYKSGFAEIILNVIEQIKNRNYPAVLNGYGGELVLVGINYDQKTKDHSCKIERIYIE